ncbi:MAG: MYG1 family protein [Parachlamydiales bacterium]|nr:MYG1 family protein [Parachlamydiales bacterium]
MSSKITRSVATHNGPFHADEVTACALLIMYGLVDKDKIVRTRDPKKIQQCEYVCDVGGTYSPKDKLFDHHQAEYTGLMSSAGMVLSYLHETKVIDDKLYRFFNNALIIGVDDHDNGRVKPVAGYCSFSHIIANYTPIEQDASEDVENAAFNFALDFVLDYLKKLVSRYEYNRNCKAIVEQVMKNSNEYMFFEKNIPWLESFFDLDGEKHPALFVVMPAGHHWKLRGVPPSYENRMQVRCPLPENWAGLLEGDLKKISGIPGAIFCHKGRFISVWETKEDAMKAMDYTLKLYKDQK